LPDVPDLPGADIPTPGLPGLPEPAPNEEQPNPDNAAGQTTTPPSNGSQDYFPWGPTAFNSGENGLIELKYIQYKTSLDTFALNTVPDTVVYGQLLDLGEVQEFGPYSWSGQGAGFRTFPAGTVAVQEFIGGYLTPFIFNQEFGFSVLRYDPKTTPSGTQYVETTEVVVWRESFDIGIKNSQNWTINGTYYWNNTITWSVQIVELKFNGIPQTPPVFAQFTNKPIYE
jgi:hypothetical protein